jgi:hypothetical protein
MCVGKDGKYGKWSNEESATYTFDYPCKVPESLSLRQFIENERLTFDRWPIRQLSLQTFPCLSLKELGGQHPSRPRNSGRPPIAAQASRAAWHLPPDTRLRIGGPPEAGAFRRVHEVRPGGPA